MSENERTSESSPSTRREADVSASVGLTKTSLERQTFQEKLSAHQIKRARSK